MPKTKPPVLEKPVRAPDEEDQATLAAIDQGIADVKAGRTVPIEEVRESLPKWISTSSSPKER
jgi:predicted transcriptional regulator